MREDLLLIGLLLMFLGIVVISIGLILASGSGGGGGLGVIIIGPLPIIIKSDPGTVLGISLVVLLAFILLLLYLIRRFKRSLDSAGLY
jgi:uncharacterized membrane protein